MRTMSRTVLMAAFPIIALWQPKQEYFQKISRHGTALIGHHDICLLTTEWLSAKIPL